MTTMRIAVLLTTFNRKEKTIACLQCLEEQVLNGDVKLDLFLTDDASSDGTTDAVKARFPDAHVFHGDGSLFWAGGTRNSWEKALVTRPDFYLLLNDDTLLYPDALDRLLRNNSETAAKYGTDVISIGSTKDKASGQLSYGGRKLFSKRKLASYQVHSDTEAMECDLGNANIMLIPKNIVERIGILSKAFVHGIADFEYTMRSNRAGFKALVAPGIYGYCTRDHGKNWRSSDTRLKDRIKYLYSPKGLAYKQYLYFIRTYFPLDLPSAFFKLWLKTLFPIFYDKFKKEKN